MGAEKQMRSDEQPTCQTQCLALAAQREKFKAQGQSGRNPEGEKCSPKETQKNTAAIRHTASASPGRYRFEFDRFSKVGAGQKDVSAMHPPANFESTLSATSNESHLLFSCLRRIMCTYVPKCIGLDNLACSLSGQNWSDNTRTPAHRHLQ